MRPFSACCNSKAVQREQHFGLRFTVAIQIEIEGHHLEELIRRQSRVEDEGKLGAHAVQVIAQALEHGCFPGAHFAGEYDKSFPAANAVDQVCQGFFVLRAAIKKLGIRTDIERVLRKPKVRIINRTLHGGLRSKR